MKKNIQHYLLAAAVVSSMAGVNSASAKAIPGQSKVKIHSPLRLTLLEDLQFGTIAPNLLTADTVVVDAATDDTSTCGAVLSCLEGGDRARFRITGRANMAIDVSVTSSTTMTNGSGDTMIADNFVLNGSGFGNGSGYIQGSGAIELGVGATLNVAADQALGDYTGTFTVTATYQ